MSITTIKYCWFRITISILLTLIFINSGFSQETSGTLTGKVIEDSRKPVSGASIEAIHSPSGTRYSISSDNEGRFTINNMRIGGPYFVTASRIGMQSAFRKDIYIRLGSAQQLELELLTKEAIIDEIVITAKSRSERADSYGTGINITNKQVLNMPSISRSITDITRLTPQGSRDNSFGGTNFRYNNITVDGAINNDAIGFSPSL